MEKVSKNIIDKKENSGDETISVIIVNYNGLSDTCELLDCFSSCFSNGTGRINNWQIEIIVIDNASKSDESKTVMSKYKWVRAIRCEENCGYAGACNIGIVNSKGKYILLINNDIILNPAELPLLIKRLNSSQKIAIVCPKLKYYSGERLIQYAGYTPLSRITLRNEAIGHCKQDDGSYDKAFATPYAHGAAMMVRRKAIDDVGLMPECYFLYYEEIDWSVMMRRSGYEIWYEPSCSIYHKESQSTGTDSPIHMYYLTRNRLLFAHRNVPRHDRFLTYAYLILFVLPKDVLKNLLKWRFDLIKATLKGVKSAFSII